MSSTSRAPSSARGRPPTPRANRAEPKNFQVFVRVRPGEIGAAHCRYGQRLSTEISSGRSSSVMFDPFEETEHINDPVFEAKALHKKPVLSVKDNTIVMVPHDQLRGAQEDLRLQVAANGGAPIGSQTSSSRTNSSSRTQTPSGSTTPRSRFERINSAASNRSGRSNATAASGSTASELKSRALTPSFRQKPREDRSIFSFDNCFSSDRNHPQYATQKKFFESVGLPVVDTIAEDELNASVLAYGQTGSGKTYTMLGPNWDDYQGTWTNDEMKQFGGNSKRDLVDLLSNTTDRGMTLRVCEELFRRLYEKQVASRGSVKYEVQIEYLQLYNDKVMSLLPSPEEIEQAHAGSGGRNNRNNSASKVLKMRVVGKEVVVEGLPKHCLKVEAPDASNPRSTYNDFLYLLKLGTERRACAWTIHNVQSSRSHAILNVHVMKKQYSRDGPRDSFSGQPKIVERHMKLTLVDLAGSERLGRSNIKADRLNEATKINGSLSTLGRVITALTDRKRKPSVNPPYRDSPLTLLLMDTFGGNARTMMIATISPQLKDLEETMSTLNYSTKAKSIQNIPKANDENAIVKALQARIRQLEAELKEKGTTFGGGSASGRGSGGDDGTLAGSGGLSLPGLPPPVRVSNSRQPSSQPQSREGSPMFNTRSTTNTPIPVGGGSSRDPSMTAFTRQTSPFHRNYSEISHRTDAAESDVTGVEVVAASTIADDEEEIQARLTELEALKRERTSMLWSEEHAAKTTAMIDEYKHQVDEYRERAHKAEAEAQVMKNLYEKEREANKLLQGQLAATEAQAQHQQASGSAGASPAGSPANVPASARSTASSSSNLPFEPEFISKMHRFVNYHEQRQQEQPQEEGPDANVVVAAGTPITQPTTPRAGGGGSNVMHPQSHPPHQHQHQHQPAASAAVRFNPEVNVIGTHRLHDEDNEIAQGDYHDGDMDSPPADQRIDGDDRGRDSVMRGPGNTPGRELTRARKAREQGGVFSTRTSRSSRGPNRRCAVPLASLDDSDNEDYDDNEHPSDVDQHEDVTMMNHMEIEAAAASTIHHTTVVHGEESALDEFGDPIFLNATNNAEPFQRTVEHSELRGGQLHTGTPVEHHGDDDGSGDAFVDSEPEPMQPSATTTTLSAQALHEQQQQHQASKPMEASDDASSTESSEWDSEDLEEAEAKLAIFDSLPEEEKRRLTKRFGLESDDGDSSSSEGDVEQSGSERNSQETTNTAPAGIPVKTQPTTVPATNRAVDANNLEEDDDGIELLRPSTTPRDQVQLRHSTNNNLLQQQREERHAMEDQSRSPPVVARTPKPEPSTGEANNAPSQPQQEQHSPAQENDDWATSQQRHESAMQRRMSQRSQWMMLNVSPETPAPPSTHGDEDRTPPSAVPIIAVEEPTPPQYGSSCQQYQQQQQQQQRYHHDPQAHEREEESVMISPNSAARGEAILRRAQQSIQSSQFVRGDSYNQQQQRAVRTAPPPQQQHPHAVIQGRVNRVSRGEFGEEDNDDMPTTYERMMEQRASGNSELNHHHQQPNHNQRYRSQSGSRTTRFSAAGQYHHQRQQQMMNGQNNESFRRSNSSAMGRSSVSSFDKPTASSENKRNTSVGRRSAPQENQQLQPQRNSGGIYAPSSRDATFPHPQQQQNSPGRFFRHPTPEQVDVNPAAAGAAGSQAIYSRYMNMNQQQQQPQQRPSGQQQQQPPVQPMRVGTGIPDSPKRTPPSEQPGKAWDRLQQQRPRFSGSPSVGSGYVKRTTSNPPPRTSSSRRPSPSSRPPSTERVHSDPNLTPGENGAYIHNKMGMMFDKLINGLPVPEPTKPPPVFR